MTKENSARWLKDMLKNFDLPMEHYQAALEMAIQALEQQPCEDAVSRKAILEHEEPMYDNYENYEYAVKSEYIESLPSVQLKSSWIPVSEKLPDMGKYVLCSVNKIYESDLEVIITQFHNEGWWTDGRIKAWMPLPKPYKTESEE